ARHRLQRAGRPDRGSASSTTRSTHSRPASSGSRRVRAAPPSLRGYLVQCSARAADVRLVSGGTAFAGRGFVKPLGREEFLMQSVVGRGRPQGPRGVGLTRALGVLLLLAGIAAALAAQTALASGGPTLPARHTAGYVPTNGTSLLTPKASVNDLEYHGGPVMRTNKTYAIYWQPTGYSFSTNYKTLIDQYFTNVAAASAASSDVYAVEKQYYDTTGPIAYSSTFGGSVTD